MMLTLRAVNRKYCTKPKVVNRNENDCINDVIEKENHNIAEGRVGGTYENMKTHENATKLVGGKIQCLYRGE